MEIKTKYNCGDIVWVVDDYTTISCVPEEIMICHIAISCNGLEYSRDSIHARARIVRYQNG